MMAQELPIDRVRWFNFKYASLEVEGDFCVVRLSDHSIYSVSSFKDALGHLSERTRRGWVLEADLWLKDDRRRHYPLGVTFDPSVAPIEYDPTNPDQPQQLNLYRGLAVEPVDGDVTRFLEFVLNVICGGDVALFDYVMDWIANLIQEPTNKPGTALVLRGDQGVGKGFFASVIGAILGPHYIELADPQYLIGRFSHHLRDKLLIYADEGSFARQKGADKLKNLITSERVLIEQKFRTPYSVDNHMRIIISGNHEQLIQASHDERRYCILEVVPIHRGDHAYWDQMFEWRDSGGAAALLHYLQDRTTASNLREIPKTNALWDHKIQSLDDFDKWWLDALQAGRIGLGRKWEEWHSGDELRDSYVDFTGLTRNRSSATQLGVLLKKRVPGVSKSRPAVGGRQTYGYRFPPLDQCRKEFDDRFGNEPDWPEELPDLKVVGGQNNPIDGD